MSSIPAGAWICLMCSTLANRSTLPARAVTTVMRKTRTRDMSEIVAADGLSLDWERETDCCRFRGPAYPLAPCALPPCTKSATTQCFSNSYVSSLGKLPVPTAICPTSARLAKFLKPAASGPCLRPVAKRFSSSLSSPSLLDNLHMSRSICRSSR